MDIAKIIHSGIPKVGEAYMSGNLEIEGNLYHALDYFMGEINKFSMNQKAMKKLIFTSAKLSRGIK